MVGLTHVGSGLPVCALNCPVVPLTLRQHKQKSSPLHPLQGDTESPPPPKKKPHTGGAPDIPLIQESGMLEVNSLIKTIQNPNFAEWQSSGGGGEKKKTTQPAMGKMVVEQR